MKPTAYLINTARGELIDDAALARCGARVAGIAGAALDVLTVEPPPPDFPLLHDENITDHAAWRLVLGSVQTGCARTKPSPMSYARFERR